MLRALSNYYDCLCRQPNSGLAPDGYSKVMVNYNLVLTTDGKIKSILPYVDEVTKGKKQVEVPREEIFPFRNSITGTSPETIDHREKYIFGLDWDKNENKFVTTKSSLSAFEKCKEKNIEFLTDVHDNLAQAYLSFMQNWLPENETENPILLELGKKYVGAKFVITLDGDETTTLNSLEEVKQLWNKVRSQKEIPKGTVFGQCSISGEVLPLARTHNNLKGIEGGQASGVNIVSCNNSAFCSYNKEQSINSSVSQKVMEKYTSAFNYLTSSYLHKKKIGDMILLFWAECYDDETPYLQTFTWGVMNDKTSEEKQDDKDRELSAIFDLMREGKSAKLKNFGIDTNTPFYILGVKPNASRLSIKVFCKNSFGKIMDNVIRHTKDMQFNENDKQMSIWYIEKCLQSPITNEPINTEITAKLIESIINGYPYPKYMLEILTRRIRTDQDKKEKGIYSVSRPRARIIKACLTRQKYINEGEYNMLNESSVDTAYSLGRLFAVLEVIQTDALGSVNATIKDKFFSSACMTPYLVFPKLLRLSQNHLEKLETGRKIHYDKLLQDIMSKFDSGFPKTLNTEKQGMFIIGYYQQKEKMFKKSNKGEEK